MEAVKSPHAQARSSSRRIAALLAAGLAFASLGACGDDGGSGTVSTVPGGSTSSPSPTPTPTPTPSPTPTPTGLVRVSGNRFLRDGLPWVPHAVQMVAFVAPPAYQTGVFYDAYQRYVRDESKADNEFTAMRAWGADSVRIQLSQPGALPGGPKSDPAFVDKYVAGVKAARAAGLTVIVSIQDEPQSGEDNSAELPTPDTIAVWKYLTDRLNGDDGIIYEMFNEPRPQPDAAGWTKWKEKMGDVVTAIRNSGATNVLLADGLNGAETLDGLTPLDDPLGQMSYSSHPYFHNDVDQQEGTWTRKFGAAAARFPVIVGEWTSVANTPDMYYCAPITTADAAHRLLQYIAANNIGLVAVAYDFNLPKYGGIVTDFAGTPTTFSGGRQCGDVGYGPGALVQGWYKTGAVPGDLE